jgi:hypothetical protein
VDQSRERQQFIYRAQAKLFDEVTEVLLTYQALALDVSWYGVADAKNPDLQRKAFAKYSDRMADIQVKLTLQSARALTLTSAPVAKKISDFLGDMYLRQDTPINNLWAKCETKCDWTDQHEKSKVVAKEATVLIKELAKDLGLEVPAAKSGA